MFLGFINQVIVGENYRDSHLSVFSIVLLLSFILGRDVLLSNINVCFSLWIRNCFSFTHKNDETMALIILIFSGLDTRRKTNNFIPL